MFFTSVLSLDSKIPIGVARLGARTASILEEKLGRVKIYTDENVDVRVGEGLRRRA